MRKLLIAGLVACLTMAAHVSVAEAGLWGVVKCGFGRVTADQARTIEKFGGMLGPAINDIYWVIAPGY